MGKMQKLRDAHGQEMIVIPRKDYDRFLKLAAREEALLDALDITDIKKQMADIKSGKVKTVPHDVAVAIAVQGVHPVRAFRTHKEWTAQELADKSGLSRAAVSHIETRRRHGTAKDYKALAQALGASVDVLLDD